MDLQPVRFLVLAGLCALPALSPTPVRAVSPLVRHAGGELGDIAIAGSVAYVGQGPSITVWSLDPTGATAPTLASTTAPLPGIVQGIATSGSWLFASYRTGSLDGAVAIFSLAQPASPTYVRDFRYSSADFLSPADLLVVGSILLAADSEIGLQVIDISNPAAPVLTSSLPGSLALRRLAVFNGDVVGWGRSFFGSLFLETFDLSSPAAPVSQAIYSAGNFFDVAFAGSFAVLSGDGLEVVDLSDLSQPSQRLLLPEAPASFAVAAVGTNFYLGTATGLHVWSLADPDAPAELGVVPAPADRTTLLAIDPTTGDLLAATETGRALTFDLANPANPSLRHQVDLPVGADATAVAADGSDLLIADFYSGLRIADTTLTSIGRLDPAIPFGAFEDVVVEGDTGFLVSWGSGVVTVDLSDRSQPATLGTLPYEFASAIAIEGDRACVVRSTNGGELAVVDITNPATPAILGATPTSKGLDVVFQGSVAMVADENAFGIGGLRIHDVSNPAIPALIGHYSLCDSAGGVDWAGPVAALACHDGTVHLVDVSNPAQPTPLGAWSDPDRFLTGHAVRMAGDRLWFGHSEGLELLDIRNPSQPRRLSSTALAAPVRGLDLEASGSGAWAAAGFAGVYLVDLVVFEDGFESGTTNAWSQEAP